MLAESVDVLQTPRVLPDAANTSFYDDVVQGLRAAPKRLPSKYFYDAKGSALFEEICRQPEYYLTVAELSIMREHAGAIAAALGPRVRLIEFGSGAGIKTRLLLRALEAPDAYVPVEISQSALRESVDRFAAEFPGLRLEPVCADFTAPLRLAGPLSRPHRTVVYFPGSTIGNFNPTEAAALLAGMRAAMGPTGAAVVGFDLKKSVATMEAAYNDAAGVTARFTLNLLTRINRELGADFDLRQFEHRARYNERCGRIETFLVSLCEQQVRLRAHTFRFASGEAMLVEHSGKYTSDEIRQLAEGAGPVCQPASRQPLSEIT